MTPCESVDPPRSQVENHCTRLVKISSLLLVTVFLEEWVKKVQ